MTQFKRIIIKYYYFFYCILIIVFLATSEIESGGKPGKGSKTEPNRNYNEKMVNGLPRDEINKMRDRFYKTYGGSDIYLDVLREEQRQREVAVKVFVKSLQEPSPKNTVKLRDGIKNEQPGGFISLSIIPLKKELRKESKKYYFKKSNLSTKSSPLKFKNYKDERYRNVFLKTLSVRPPASDIALSKLETENILKLLTVEDNKSSYLIKDGTEVLYQGNDFNEICKTIHSNVGENTKIVYLDLEKFSGPHKIDAFKTSLSIHENIYHKDLTIKIPADNNLSKMLLSNDTKLITCQSLPIDEVRSGKYKGYYKLKSIWVNFKQNIRVIEIQFFTKSKLWIEKYQLFFRERINYNKKACPIECIEQFYIKMMNDYNKRFEDLENECLFQIGNTRIVSIDKSNKCMAS